MSNARIWRKNVVRSYHSNAWNPSVAYYYTKNKIQISCLMSLRYSHTGCLSVTENVLSLLHSLFFLPETYFYLFARLISHQSSVRLNITSEKAVFNHPIWSSSFSLMSFILSLFNDFIALTAIRVTLKTHTKHVFCLLASPEMYREQTQFTLLVPCPVSVNERMRGHWLGGLEVWSFI